MQNGIHDRREFLKIIGVAAAGAVGLSGCAVTLQVADDKRKKPNILLILVDDLGYGDLGCYGAKDLRTPHIDRLMSEGMRIDQFYANCPVCSPTRAALLTGRYPDIVGVPGVIRNEPGKTFGYLDPKAILLPKVLKSAGYHTAIIGKWHLGLQSPNTPNERGFDHFHGFLGDMMDDYFNHRRTGMNWMRLDEKEIDPVGHATDLFSDWSVDHITDRAGKNKPFFLYLAYNAPHVPIQSPEGWEQKVLKREKGIGEKRAKIVAMIEHLDDGIGKVINSLKRTKQFDNTLIFFVSDNGGQEHAGASNGKLNGMKGQMLEGGIKVPFCAVWNGKIPAGTRDRQSVALTMDLFATICDAAGAKYNHTIEGKSILGVLEGKEKMPCDRFVFWMRREGGRSNGQIFYAARFGDWKILQAITPFESYQFYNLKDDPYEKNPLSHEHPMFIKLFEEMQKHIIKAGAVPWHYGMRK